MNSVFKKILLVSIVMIGHYAFAAECCDTSKVCTPVISKNFWNPHAFSAYTSRELLMMKGLHHSESSIDTTKTFSVAFEYMQSFDRNCEEVLGRMPFWSGTNTMTIGTHDGLSDVDASQFGMGNVTKEGSITFNPRVQHLGMDMLFYWLQNKEKHGFFAKVKAPLGAMIIDYNLCETPAVLAGAVDTAWSDYPAPKNRPETLTEAFNGGSTETEGIVKSNLHKPIALDRGRISPCKLTAIRLADLSATIGYNVAASDRGFLGIGLKVACPTGNVPTGKYILEPVFGRAGHWGVGGELSAYYNLWENDCSSLDFWLQGEALHLTTGRRPSFRSFDLKQNGQGSKYMLLQFYFPGNPTGTGLAVTTPENPSGMIPSFITQAVNVTTMPVLSEFAVEGSISAMLNFKKDNWKVGVGGEFWGRSQECLSIDMKNAINQNMANLNDYAVMGRQMSEDSRYTDPQVLYFCEPLATIKKSQARVFYPDNNTMNSPPATPNPASSPSELATLLAANPGIEDARLTQNRIPANLKDALDISGAQEPRSLTGKVFAEFGYTWIEHAKTPKLSIFGSAEFADTNSNMVNLWSVGIHGSVNY